VRATDTALCTAEFGKAQHSGLAGVNISVQGFATQQYARDPQAGKCPACFALLMALYNWHPHLLCLLHSLRYGLPSAYSDQTMDLRV